MASRKEVMHNRLNIRLTLKLVALEPYLVGKGKRTRCSIYLLQTDLVKDEVMRLLLKLLIVLIVLLKVFNTS